MFRSLSLWLLLIFTGFSAGLEAQSARTISVEVDNFDGDTILLAYFYGNRQYISDTAKRAGEHFVFKAEEPWKTGVYLVVLPPDNRYMQVIISEREGNMRVSIDANALDQRPGITNSVENKVFWDYLIFLNDKNREASEWRQKLAEASPLGMEKKKYQEKLDVLDAEVKGYQNRLIKEHGETLAAAIVKANIDVDMPEFEGEKEAIDKMRFAYYRKHYFDNMDLADPRLIRTPVFFDKVDRYIAKYTVQIPDSINRSLDYVLKESEGAEENYKFLLVHYLNEYAKSKYVGQDAMYVHLVDNYYAQGKAPWVEEEQLEKLVTNANELRPLLIGKTAPNLKVYKQDLTPIELHDVEARFTVLFFWAPDCGHCKKSMPALVDFYEKYKAKGVEVFAICTKLLEKEATCWESVEEFGMGNWVNTSDKYLRSKFGQVYNVKSTPQLYILDAGKEILTKQVAVDKLGEMIDLIITEQDGGALAPKTGADQ
jgi:thiol-disulfide isomerase/thioredoxin